MISRRKNYGCFPLTRNCSLKTKLIKISVLGCTNRIIYMFVGDYVFYIYSLAVFFGARFGVLMFVLS